MNKDKAGKFLCIVIVLSARFEVDKRIVTRDHHLPSNNELLLERLRNLIGCRRDQNPIVGFERLISQSAVAQNTLYDAGAHQAEFLHIALGHIVKLRKQFDRRHPAASDAYDISQKRARPSGTAPDIENLLSRFRVKKLEHDRHGRRLGYRLPETDRERNVGFRLLLELRRNEIRPRYLIERPNDRLCFP